MNTRTEPAAIRKGRVNSQVPKKEGRYDRGEIVDRIKKQILDWPDASVHPHHFGGIEFRVEGKEIGHLYSDKLVELPVPTEICKELHHMYPDMGVSYWPNSIEEVPNVISLFRRKYELLKKAAVNRGLNN